MVEPTNYQNVDGIYECIKQQVCFDENIEPLPYDHISNGLVFMKSTGLKDKNGKFIYEGDIIKGYFNDSDSGGTYFRIMTVVYEEKLAAFGFKDSKNYCEFLTTVDFEQQDYEIIGNIYENPELLKKGGDHGMQNI